MLKGKKIFVLGASSGIGQVLVKSLSENGAQVFGSYNENQVASAHPDHFWKIDLLDQDSVKVACDKLEKEHFDGFVNCAGINIADPLISLDRKQIEQQIDINLKSPIFITQAILKMMIRNKSGSIIHLGSVSSHRFFRGHSVYSASKAGLEGFVKAMASEVAKRGIRVNCVLPGPVLTPMLQKSMDQTGVDPKENIPMGKLITAEEIAEACLFLLSDKCPSLTGAVIPVDGGYLLW